MFLVVDKVFLCGCFSSIWVIALGLLGCSRWVITKMF